jgi:hypothetical protein
MMMNSHNSVSSILPNENIIALFQYPKFIMTYIFSQPIHCKDKVAFTFGVSASNVRPINIELAICKKLCTTNITTMLSTINFRIHTTVTSLPLFPKVDYSHIQSSFLGMVFFFLSSPRWMMHHPTRGIISPRTWQPSYFIFEHSRLVL